MNFFVKIIIFEMKKYQNKNENLIHRKLNSIQMNYFYKLNKIINEIYTKVLNSKRLIKYLFVNFKIILE